MSDFQWLKSYPSFVPANVNLDGYNSIVDIYEEGLVKYTDKIAYKNMDVEMSFTELGEYVDAFTWYLQNKTNLKKR